MTRGIGKVLSLPTHPPAPPLAPPATTFGGAASARPGRGAATFQASLHRALTMAGVVGVSLALVGLGSMSPASWLPVTALATGALVEPLTAEAPALFTHPLFELAKLVAAALVGLLVTLVHRQYRHDRSPNPALDQAQVLLCISGALMMMLIGNSLARAFGIAGAASIIRFRTPVEDARDITILFLLMGLGMAAGLGAFAVAGLGTLFLCATLPLLNLLCATPPRVMQVEIVADGPVLPMAHIQQVFSANGISYEPREVSHGSEAIVRYRATLALEDSIERISVELAGDGRKGIKHVAWSPPKRG